MGAGRNDGLKTLTTNWLQFEVFLPFHLGEGWGEGLCASSFAPSPNPSQSEGKKPHTFQQLIKAFLTYSSLPFPNGRRK